MKSEKNGLKKIKGKRVFVGISGGVDSATTAALLVRAGAKVTGVFIKGWYPENMPCTWASDRRDAMHVSARLHIPFITLDASKEYKRNVIDYMLAEYAVGNTPNPDVMCNRDVKFGVFAKFAYENKADFIATGHYARTAFIKDGVELLRGVDEGKDQSYFLWAVSKDVLSRALFPLGDMQKKDVRALARKFNLPVAKKKDSQGVCFLGDVSVEEFLKAEFKPETGRAIDENGNEIGVHAGAVLYTLGEKVSLSEASAGPWYVVKKNMERNEVVVSKKRTLSNKKTTSLTLRDCNWFSDFERATSAQYRYHGPIISGKVSFEKGKYIFSATDSFPELPASGQSLVVYAGEQCVGGGIIM